MVAAFCEFPSDVAGCHAVIRHLLETVERLRTDNSLLKRALFGSRRERFVEDPDQRHLFDLPKVETAVSTAPEREPAEAAETKSRRTSAGRGQRVFPEGLPRKQVHHRLNEENLPEVLRGEDVQRFYKKTSEELEFEPASLHVVEHYQQVVVRNDEQTGETAIASASKPARLIDAYSGPGFWAYLTASRFADHLPYYRQEDILSRYGFRIDRSTQWRWMHGLAEGVSPLVELIRQRTLASLVLGVDETPVKMLQSGGTVKSYLWTAVGDRGHPYDCFFFTTDRSRDGPDMFLAGYEGYLLSDAYICYELISAASDKIHRTGCWAHARRKFEELDYVAPTLRSQRVLASIQRLYDIEDRAGDLSDHQRHELRQREARPIVAELGQWLHRQFERELPKSKFRAAIGYMTSRWDAFERYLEHGAIPIDNNRAEAALKYPVIGRKSWLFFGNEQGGATAATLFTLTKSCNRHSIDPYAYLRDVYTRLPMMDHSELETLLPDRWIERHPEHRLEQRVDEARQRADRKRKRRQRRRQLVASAS